MLHYTTCFYQKVLNNKVSKVVRCSYCTLNTSEKKPQPILHMVKSSSLYRLRTACRRAWHDDVRLIDPRFCRYVVFSLHKSDGKPDDPAPSLLLFTSFICPVSSGGSESICGFQATYWELKSATKYYYWPLLQIYSQDWQYSMCASITRIICFRGDFLVVARLFQWSRLKIIKNGTLALAALCFGDSRSYAVFVRLSWP